MLGKIKKLKTKKPKIRVSGVKFKVPKFKREKKIKQGNRKFFIDQISLKYKLIGSLVLFASLPIIIISIFSSNANMDAIENSVGSYSQRMVQQFGHSFDNMIDQARNTLTIFMLLDDEIKRTTLEPDSADGYEVYKKEMMINEQVQSLLNGNNMLNGIIILNSNGKMYSKDNFNALQKEREYLLNNEFFKTPLLDSIKNSSGPYWFTSIGEGVNGVYVGWYYKSYRENVEGVIIVSLDMKQADDLISTFHIEGVSKFQIINQDKVVVEGTQKDDIGTLFEEEYIDELFGEEASATIVHSKQLVSYFTLKNGWKAVYSAPLSGLLEDVVKIIRNMVLVGIVCVALAIILGYGIATSISNPIKKLSEAMAEAETGNLNVEYTMNSNNEIGQLVKSFNQMIANIKALILDTKVVAETIEGNTETLQVVSAATAASASQITQAIESVAKGTEDQTVQIVHSSQMMTDLSENINIATEKVKDVQQVANNTMTVSNETVSVMEDLTNQAEQTIKISGQIEAHIEELGSEAEQIINVIGMIQGISDQTNLLALNATIEAARAGEAGRGFGVVADEIRKLANQSREATARIEQIVSSIMKKKDTTIQGAREATSLFMLQMPVVSHTNEAFGKIHQEMERVVTQLDELTDLFGEITQHKDETVDAISEIADIIGHSAAAAEEVFATSAEQSASAEKIADMANVLQKGVEELKTSQQKFRI